MRRKIVNVKKASKIKRILMFPFKHKWFDMVLAGTLIIFLGAILISAITNSSKPGDFAYFIDRGFERLRVSTTVSASARFEFKTAIAQERLNELLELDINDTNRIMKSLDELDNALNDMQSDVDKVDEFGASKDDANQIINNLKNLVASYRDFLDGKVADTVAVQDELNNKIPETNKVVDHVNKTSTIAKIVPIPYSAPAPTPTTTPSPTPAPTSTPTHTPEPTPTPEPSPNCTTSYSNLGNQTEKQGLKLDKNSCGEYTVSYGGKTHILIYNKNLDYAVGEDVKFHGTKGTNNSIFITEFALDD